MEYNINILQKPWMVWGDFLSLYFQFYAVIILENIYATGERKIQMYL
jgi:hypothetical protein